MGSNADRVVNFDIGTNLVQRDLEQGFVTIEGVINAPYASAVAREVREVHRLQQDDPDRAKHIEVLLLSGGGGVYPAMAMYDTFRNYPGTVNITATGIAASAAAMIVLQAGDRRLATPNTRLMVHEIRAWFGEGIAKPMSEAKDDQREMEALQEHIIHLLVGRSGKERAFWEERIQRRETWFSAEEAVTAGLIDGIATYI